MLQLLCEIYKTTDDFNMQSANPYPKKRIKNSNLRIVGPHVFLYAHIKFSSKIL